MKEIMTTNFGFAGWLNSIKEFEIVKIVPKDGIFFKIPEEIFQKELKEEYNNSDFRKYNDTLRDIISKFK